VVEWTKITPAHSKTKAKRVTIPEAIANTFNLEAGDAIGWVIIAKSEGVLGVELVFEKQAK
jgi:bifunctional DNA-binding transcriptional regulator/antitoxin component of YhaV-PrlF toxin-antitoxin module